MPGRCDVVMGVPAQYGLLQPTRSYYRSSYAFVSRRDRHLRIDSFDAPELKVLTIGIQVTGDDYNNPPAAQELASRHIVQNVRGFTIYGDYSRPDPQRDIVDAVADGRVDVAVVWGPLAGYYAQRAAHATGRHADRRGQRRVSRFTFDIAMGVRHDDTQLRAALDDVIRGAADEIRRILRGVRSATPMTQSWRGDRTRRCSWRRVGGSPPHGGATAAPPPLLTAVGPIPGPPTAARALPNPYADDRTARVEGRQLFVRFNCSGCHGGRAGGGMGPSLRDVDWIYGNDDAQLFSSIAEGRAHGMPSWHTRLTQIRRGSWSPISNPCAPVTSRRRRRLNRGRCRACYITAVAAVFFVGH